MGKIIVLDELTINKIAAGEVIERPASVVKELVENSIDAGATAITIEIRRGGKSYIRVTDNGSGIPEDDVLMAFEKHATSKIRTSDDLDSILTLGFRGEALASIAAVSKVELITKTADAPYGTRVEIHGGSLASSSKCGCPSGTTFIIRELFYNTPARFKFLKKDATEASHIIDTVERIALARPDISFRLINSGTEVLRTPGDGNLKNAVFSVYGRDIVRNMTEIDFSEEHIQIGGFAGNIETAVSGRSRQSIYINGRYIRSKIISSAIDEAYKTLMMKGKYPFIILKITINPHYVDVNVHPTKMEVRFSDENTIFRCVYGAITGALFGRKEQLTDITEKGREVKQEPLPASREECRELPAYHEKYAGTSQLAEQAMEVKKPQASYFPPQQEPITLPLTREEDIKDAAAPAAPAAAFLRETGPDSNLLAMRQLLKEARYVGQIFDTYIILSYKDEIIFIDQHAAHERVLYEELMKSATNGGLVTQYLLHPVSVDLAGSEYAIYKSNRKIFNMMGFQTEDFGTNSILVRALPSILGSNDVKTIVVEIIREIMEGTSRGRSLLPEDKLYDMACKAAVKANMKLDYLEIRELLDRMAQLDNPFTCPHGRPLTVRMSKRELEKKFKRIV